MDVSRSSQAPRCIPASHSASVNALAARISQSRWKLLGKSSISTHLSPHPFLTSFPKGSRMRGHSCPDLDLPPVPLSLTPCICAFSFPSAPPQPAKNRLGALPAHTEPYHPAPNERFCWDVLMSCSDPAPRDFPAQSNRVTIKNPKVHSL